MSSYEVSGLDSARNLVTKITRMEEAGAAGTHTVVREVRGGNGGVTAFPPDISSNDSLPLPGGAENTEGKRGENVANGMP